MISYVKNLLTDGTAEELLRLARLDPLWIEWRLETISPDERRIPTRVKYPTGLTSYGLTGGQVFSHWAFSMWLLKGPKVFRPTLAQCAALEQISVNLALPDYCQPYPTVLVEMPPGYSPFVSVLVHHHMGEPNPLLVCHLIGKDRTMDISTTVTWENKPIEEVINTFSDDCRADAVESVKVLRVAINSCLALTNFGCYSQYLLPKEIERDTKLAQEHSLRGLRAKERLPLQLQLVSFSQEVTIHHTEERRTKTTSEGGLGELSTHWRRGHWAMQPYGPNRSLRKRILRPPVLIRADKFIGSLSNTSTAYKS